MTENCFFIHIHIHRVSVGECLWLCRTKDGAYFLRRSAIEAYAVPASKLQATTIWLVGKYGDDISLVEAWPCGGGEYLTPAMRRVLQLTE